MMKMKRAPDIHHAVRWWLLAGVGLIESTFVLLTFGLFQPMWQLEFTIWLFKKRTKIF